MSPAHRRGLQLDLQINKELDSLSKLFSCKQAVEKGLSGSLRSIASLEFMLVEFAHNESALRAQRARCLRQTAPRQKL
jgi:hypothetical protein